MEIRTTKSYRDTEDPESDAAPEGSMYLRRKNVQKVRKSQSAGRGLLRAAKLAGKSFVGAMVLAFLVSVVIYAFTSDRFLLQTVTFKDCRNSDSRQLERIIRKEFPAHLMQIDLKQLRNRLEKEIWCRRVEIRRVLPSELVIYVQERVPSVVLEINGELMIADEDGVLLDKYDPRYGKLDVPVFKGFSGNNADGYRQNQAENAERIQTGLRMLADLETGSTAFTRGISEVDLSDKDDVRMILVDDTAEIHLGDRDFLKRLRKLMDNMGRYRELKAQGYEIATIELRFEGQIIYRPRKTDGAELPATAEARR
ncbi:MAG: Cell division protein FtsQ [Bacteroidetes bacterium]|nr:Cell division protein FtsQ [Bacteroidota bacterium]